MNYTDFKTKYAGKGIDFDGYYGFQCMDLAHQYATEIVGYDFAPAPAAKDVWNQNINGYDKIPNSPTGVPSQGDIVIWGTAIGPYGHIAVFDNGDANKFQSFDQNWPINSLCHLQDHNYNGVLGWFHPKVSQEPMATITQKELDEIRNTRDQHYNELQQKIAEINELDKEIEILKGEISELQKKLVTGQPVTPEVPPTPPPTNSFIDKLRKFLGW